MPPRNTAGSVMSTESSLMEEIMFTSSMKAPNNKKQARLADPTE